MIFIVKSGSSGTITVGISMGEKNVYETILVDKLLEQEDINVVIAQSEDVVRDKVRTGEFNVGYIIKDNFTNNLKDLKMDEAIELVKLENDFYYKYVNQIIVTILYEQVVPIISKELLDSYNIEIEVDRIYEKINNYNVDEDVFKINIIHTGEKIEHNPFDLLINLINGVICIFLLILSLIASVFCSGDEYKHSLFKPYLGQVRLKLYSIFPIYFYSFLVAVLSILIVKILLPHSNFVVPLEIVKVLIYQVSLMIYTITISNFVNKDSTIVLIPFVMIGLIITHPIFFDFTTLVPNIKFILYLLPTYQYLEFGLISILMGLILNTICLCLLNKVKD